MKLPKSICSSPSAQEPLLPASSSMEGSALGPFQVPWKPWTVLSMLTVTVNTQLITNTRGASGTQSFPAALYSHMWYELITTKPVHAAAMYILVQMHEYLSVPMGSQRVVSALANHISAPAARGVGLGSLLKGWLLNRSSKTPFSHGFYRI